MIDIEPKRKKSKKSVKKKKEFELMNDVQQIQNSPVKSKLFRCFENFIYIDTIFIISSNKVLDFS